MNPYALPILGTSSNGASNNTGDLNWLTQPYQFNSSGTLPGTTVINVGQDMQINGNTGVIGVGGSNTTNNTVTVDGKNSRILVTNASSGINQIIIGLLPDGTYGMVVSKLGIDVLTLFS